MNFMKNLNKVVDATMSAVGKEAQVESDNLDLAEPVTALVVEVDNGDVSISAGPEGHVGASVQRTLHFHSTKPQLSCTHVDGTLTLTSRGTSTLKTERCDHVITIPATATVEVRSKVGSVQIFDIAGAITARGSVGSIDIARASGLIEATCSTGAIAISQASGDLQAKTSAGSIRADGLTCASAKFTSETGSIKLLFDAAPTSLELKSNIGSVHAEVPQDRYVVDTVSSVGSVRIEGLEAVPPGAALPADAPQRVITARTDVGSIVLRGRQ